LLDLQYGGENFYSQGGLMEYYDISHFHSNKEFQPVLSDLDFREVLADIIYIVPRDVIDDVLDNCFFLMLNRDVSEGACYIPNKLIAKKYILAFHDHLYSKDEEKKAHIILHEIAHYVLKHVDEGQTKDKYDNEEKDASALADKWINDWQKYYYGSKAK
jgi:hypothetical protein